MSTTAATAHPSSPDEPDVAALAHPAAAPPAAHVALLYADPSFAAGIPAADLPLADRVLRVPRLQLEAGAWLPPERGLWPAPTSALLVLDGVIARHAALADRVATQLLGPGDVVDAWSRANELVPCSVRWSVHEPATVAVLDGRFATAARRWPALAATVHARLGAVADRLATHLAICQLPRVEQRVLALLWHLAERFGRVTPEGVVLPLRLTHRLVGELAGAQRPTVSLAFGALLEDGRVTRREDGSLVLAAGSWADLEPSGPPAAPVTVPVPTAPATARRLADRRADDACWTGCGCCATTSPRSARAPSRS